VVKILFSLSVDQLNWLKRIGMERRCTMGDVVRKCIADYIFLKEFQSHGGQILIEQSQFKKVILP